MAAPLILPRSVFGANERIRVAVLGVNGRGKDHIKGMMNQPGVEVATLCDPDSTISAERAKEFEKSYNRPVKTEQDLRRVFDDKEIDAVTIATPNHWHALAAIWACQAGKDVYVEKPGTHNVWEGRKLIEAAAKYSRIVQNGVQLRSSAAIQEAIGHLRKGTIGQVYMARGLVFRWRPD
ncbi:MAG TPA: Gfo/Idh/MocA family oxidoreductase, partial [bacterium]|nr:Gfo/Idh/MocA family oxidoreductase [bacterium]